ncbi:hypothetical protein ACFXGT_01210 [Streptomyces sp. NPDC059352]|uniref:hypothetical protein n=1 Tax=Streptomyces sp. NPDC059352 TaxID=3346810 RepID=UPI00367CDC6E
MTTTPSLVLRGSGAAVLRFEEGAVTLGRPGEDHHIPLAAIGRVRAEGRTVAIELTAPEGTEPTVCRVEDVSEAAVTAFADAVNTALPERTEAVDGSTLVTTHVLAAPAPRSIRVTRRKVIAIGAAVPLLALDVFLGVAGRMEYAIIFWLALLAVAAGGSMAFSMGRDLYRKWYLPRHGITVVATFSHHTYKHTRVYRYTDTNGISRTYKTPVGGSSFELSYDPRDPEVAVHPESVFVRCLTSLMLLVGCGLAGGGLYGIGWLVVTTLRG